MSFFFINFFKKYFSFLIDFANDFGRGSFFCPCAVLVVRGFPWWRLGTRSKMGLLGSAGFCWVILGFN